MHNATTLPSLFASAWYQNTNITLFLKSYHFRCKTTSCLLFFECANQTANSFQFLYSMSGDTQSCESFFFFQHFLFAHSLSSHNNIFIIAHDTPVPVTLFSMHLHMSRTRLRLLSSKMQQCKLYGHHRAEKYPQNTGSEFSMCNMCRI